MKTFLVSKGCWDLGLRAGAIVVRDVRITQASSKLRSEIDEEVQVIRNRYSSLSEIRAIPELVKLQDILRNVNVRPRKRPPSTQKLLEFALKRGTLPAVNNLVDAYNLVSVRTKCSLGAHDLDKITVPVELRLFEGNQSFRPLGGNEDEKVKPGEFGYVDANDRVICRLDSVQADFSKVTADTTRVLIIIEATSSHTAEQLEKAFADTKDIVNCYCGGTSEVVAFPF
jgi:DNA/RNA-binding domain of Phe-tRNA-synthetase-like protein